MDIGSICLCLVVGALIVFASIGIGVCFGRNDNRDNQRQSDGDSDVRTDVPIRDRDRCRDNGRAEQAEPEEVTNVLYMLRIGASDHEKRVIDYLIDKEAKE